MKKSSRIELNWEQTEKLITFALEERNPFEIIKKEFGLAEKEVLEIMKKNSEVYDFMCVFVIFSCKLIIVVNHGLSLQ